jgi:hypothetical protein
MRLNGWQRIGIVASVIWAIGAPIYLDHAAEQEASEAFERFYVPRPLDTGWLRQAVGQFRAPVWVTALSLATQAGSPCEAQTVRDFAEMVNLDDPKEFFRVIVGPNLQDFLCG